MRKKIETKLTAIFMMIALIVTMIPMTVFADEPETVSRIDLGNVWTALDVVNPVTFTTEINPGDEELLNQIYIANEAWTDTETGTVYDYANANIPEGEHTYRYSVVINTYDGYQFDENLTFIYGGSETTATMNFNDDMTSVMISGFVNDVYVEPNEGGNINDDQFVVRPLNVVINDNTTTLDGATISIEPAVAEDLYESYGLSESDLTAEEKTALIWRSLLCNMNDGETLTVNISDREVSDSEVEQIKNEVTYMNEKPIKVLDDGFKAVSVSMDLDGTPVDAIYNSVSFYVNGLTGPEGADTFVPVYVDSGGYPVQAMDAAYNDDTLTWISWSPEGFDFIFAPAAFYKTGITPIDVVEINGATLSFKAGDDVVFTGKSGAPDMYDMNSYSYETWVTPEGEMAVSSEEIRSDEYYDGFSKFDYDKTYAYGVGVEMNRDKFLEEGYYFPQDVKLKLNGVEYDCEDKYVADDGQMVDFYSVVSFTTEKKPATSTDISKAALTIANQTYTGKALTPNVKVVVGKTTLKKGTDYTVNYKNNINAGTATATITGKGNYTGTVSKAFTIAKAKNGMTVKAKKINAQIGKKVTVKKNKAFTVKKAFGKVTFKKTKGNKKISVSNKGKVTVKKGLKAGTYKVKVKVTAAGDKNHNKKSKTVTMKVTVK